MIPIRAAADPGVVLTTTTSAPTGAERTATAGGIAAAVGTTAANVLSYGLSLAGARLLAPADYGVLVALLAVTLVASVPALALQAVVAVRVVRAAGDGHRVTASSVGLGLAAAAAMVALGLAATPVLERFLDLSGPAAVVWVALAVGATTVLAVLQGVAQGRQDFHRLALILVVYAAARVAGGIAGLLVFGSVAGTLAGVAAGVTASVAVAWVLTGRPRPARGGWQVRELLVACQALAGLYLLTNLDPVLARHYLPATEAGLYGAGAVLAKAAFFLPQAVVLVLFPRLASSPRPGRTLWLGLGALTGLGLLMTAVTRLAGGLAVTAVGGDAYRDLAAHAYLFVAVGSALGVVQLLLYAQLTADRAHATIGVWAVVAGEAAAVATVAHGSLVEVVGAALGTALVAAVLGLAWTARITAGRDAAAADPATATPPRPRSG
ncbi:MAG TPA: oligosaccharide flippase family protein [Mycobacteriales bacterium]|nr:oligosaccharide flippase family protein [Mycobacteriales bacterium]